MVVNPLHSNSSIVVIGDLDHDVIQNINQPGQRIILIDIYDNHDEIYYAQLAMLNSDFKNFPLNLCINKKTVMHLQQSNVATVKTILGKEIGNKYYHMQSGIVMKCVINLLTLMGYAGAIELHAPHSLCRTINKVDNLQLDYRHIDENMMKNYQLYLTTYYRLHNLTFRQCYRGLGKM